MWIKEDNTFNDIRKRSVEQWQKYSGWTAQIIQHEIDHCSRVMI